MAIAPEIHSLYLAIHFNVESFMHREKPKFSSGKR